MSCANAPGSSRGVLDKSATLVVEWPQKSSGGVACFPERRRVGGNMAQNEKKGLGWRVPLIGAGLVLLAVLLILGVVFLPRAQQKRKMRNALTAFSESDISYILVIDPLYDTGDLLGNDGKELSLDAAQTGALLEALEAINAAGLRYAGEEALPAGSFDLRVLLRAEDGALVQFYVREHTLGYLDGTAYYSFETQKDSEAIPKLYTMLSEWIENG